MSRSDQVLFNQIISIVVSVCSRGTIVVLTIRIMHHNRFLILDIAAIGVNCIDIGKLLPKLVNDSWSERIQILVLRLIRLSEIEKYLK